MNRARAAIGHARASLTAMGIVAYFGVTTVWIPSALLRSSLLIGLERNVSDLIAVAVWGAGLGIGIWLLRWAQDRDLI